VPPGNTSFKDPGLDWLDSIFDPSGSGFSSSLEGAYLGNSGLGNQSIGSGFVSDQAQLLSLESPDHALANVLNSGVGSMGITPMHPPPLSNSLGINPNSTSLPTQNMTMLNPHSFSQPLALKREPQLEDVTSWANISHFISLFLQYLYPLLPLVHRPTFAEHLATRRDMRDMDFRALLLSIGKFVIDTGSQNEGDKQRIGQRWMTGKYGQIVLEGIGAGV
jgi:hypothetical protein